MFPLKAHTASASIIFKRSSYVLLGKLRFNSYISVGNPIALSKCIIRSNNIEVTKFVMNIAVENHTKCEANIRT